MQREDTGAHGRGGVRAGVVRAVRFRRRGGRCQRQCPVRFTERRARRPNHRVGPQHAEAEERDGLARGIGVVPLRGTQAQARAAAARGGGVRRRRGALHRGHGRRGRGPGRAAQARVRRRGRAVPLPRVARIRREHRGGHQQGAHTRLGRGQLARDRAHHRGGQG